MNKQPIDALNSFNENNGLFNASEEHYNIAQMILKSESATEEQKNAAAQACMSYVNKTRATRIDSDVVKILNTFK